MDIPSPGQWGLVIATAMLLSPGCAHYPYGPSYYNYGPYSPTPAYGPSYGPTMSPGPVYSPSGPTLQPLPGNPGLPGNPSSPTPINPSITPSTPVWTPDTSSTPSAPLNDAPPFRPTNPGNPVNPGGAGNNTVPFPVEPGFDAPPPAAALPRAMPIADSSQVPSRPVSTVSASEDSFEAPRRVPSMPTQLDDPFAMNPPATTVNKQDPYGYDGDKYTWLRGMVDFDAPSNTWSIIYDLTPDIRDKFGGSFVFAPHQSLATLKPGALVLAKGRVDPGRTDAHGKALYEIVQLIHLAPPNGIQ